MVVSPSYSRHLSNGASLELALDYTYTSQIFDDNSNEPPESRDPTTFYDARVLLHSPGKHWSFSLWGKNLGNEQTQTFQGTFSGVTFGAFNPPRTYGASVRWNY